MQLEDDETSALAFVEFGLFALERVFRIEAGLTSRFDAFQAGARLADGVFDADEGALFDLFVTQCQLLTRGHGRLVAIARDGVSQGHGQFQSVGVIRIILPANIPE